MKYHIHIESITYEYLHSGITKCTIRWINPLTGNFQRSVGISKCNPEDKFDEILGKRIAEGRAKINMWWDYRNSISKFQVETHRKYTHLIHHEVNHVIELKSKSKRK